MKLVRMKSFTYTRVTALDTSPQSLQPVSFGFGQGFFFVSFKQFSRELGNGNVFPWLEREERAMRWIQFVKVMSASIWCWVTHGMGGGHVCPLQAGMDYAPLILARCSSCTHETCVYICLCSCVITAGSSPLVSVSPEPPGSAKKPHWFCQRAWHTSANTLALFLVESPGAVECIETHPASTGDGVVIRLPRSLANKEASDNKKN